MSVWECGNTIPDLSNLVFCSGQVRKFLFTYMKKVNTNLYFIYD